MQLNKMNKYDKIETLFIKSKKQKLLEDREELILKKDEDIYVPEVYYIEKSTKKAWKNLIGNYKRRVKVSPPVTSIVKILDQTNENLPQMLAVIS